MRGNELDTRTDLFNFGTVRYEMATVIMPFRGDTSGVMIEVILLGAPVPTFRLNPETSLRSVLSRRVLPEEDGFVGEDSKSIFHAGHGRHFRAETRVVDAECEVEVHEHVSQNVDLYLRYVAGLPAHLSRIVIPGIVLGLALPYVNSIHSRLRGLLVAAHTTRVVYWGMGLNLAITASLMIAGVIFQAPGTPTGVLALTAAFIAEICYLRKIGGSVLAA